MSNKVILPIRLDSYAGDESALEAHFYEAKEEYGGKSVPDDSMWAAVYILDGKIDHSMTEYGYRSLEELLKTFKGEKIIGLRDNRKDAELEEARTGRAKKTGIDKDEVFYSLCIEDIFWQAKEMKIPRKKLTTEIIKEIKDRIGDKMGSANYIIMDAISEVIGEKEE